MGSTQSIEGRRDNLVVRQHGAFRHLDVVVLFTTIPGTLEALRSAADLAHGLRARIRLLVPHVVAYPLPLDQPAVQLSVLVRRFIAISQHAEAETTIDIRLCRDPWDAIREALSAPSIVVLGGRRRWWPTREDSMARRLRSEGHHVVLTESK
jgi:hypothetical protein